MKKKFWITVVLFLLATVLLSACDVAGGSSIISVQSSNPTPSVVTGPTHFICYQAGQKVIDAETLNGINNNWVFYKGYGVKSWIWDDKAGHHTLNSDSSFCEEIKTLQ